MKPRHHPHQARQWAARSPACLAALIASLCGVPVEALADERRKDSWLSRLGIDRRCEKKPEAGPEFPGGDIFGFTSPTDIGDPCSLAYAAELIGRAGKSDGRYHTGTAKLQVSYTFDQYFAVAVSPFFSAFSWRDVASHRETLRNAGVWKSRLNALDFDGVSAEASWRLVPRTAQQPLAVTVSTEARFFRRDSGNGHRAEGRQLEMKVFADLALSERLFVAANAIYGVGTARLSANGTDWHDGSAAGFSGALTYRLYAQESGAVQAVFVGAELRHIRGFDGPYFNNKEGVAWLAGPTLAMEFSGGRTLSMVWTPQFAGHATRTGAPRSLDLETCERHQFKLKFAASF